MYTNEHIARICHEVNGSFCNSVGDHSQKSWDEAEEWQRESAIKGVAYAIANPNAAPSEQHDAWSADKIADGWKYGPVKDADKKEHPCLVPYNELPLDQRTKDHLFKAIVRAMTGAAVEPAHKNRELIQDDSTWRHRKEHYLVSIEQSGPKYTLFRRRVSVLAGGQRPIRRKLTKQFLKKFELYGPVPS